MKTQLTTIGILCVAFLLISCQSSTPIPTSTSTPPPTHTPIPTATIPPFLQPEMYDGFTAWKETIRMTYALLTLKGSRDAFESATLRFRVLSIPNNTDLTPEVTGFTKNCIVDQNYQAEALNWIIHELNGVITLPTDISSSRDYGFTNLSYDHNPDLAYLDLICTLRTNSK